MDNVQSHTNIAKAPYSNKWNRMFLIHLSQNCIVNYERQKSGDAFHPCIQRIWRKRRDSKMNRLVEFSEKNYREFG